MSNNGCPSINTLLLTLCYLSAFFLVHIIVDHIDKTFNSHQSSSCRARISSYTDVLLATQEDYNEIDRAIIYPQLGGWRGHSNVVCRLRQSQL